MAGALASISSPDYSKRPVGHPIDDGPAMSIGSCGGLRGAGLPTCGEPVGRHQRAGLLVGPGWHARQDIMQVFPRIDAEAFAVFGQILSAINQRNSV